MWPVVVEAGSLLAVAICAWGWFTVSRRLAESTREREDLANSSAVIEVERRMLELVAQGAPLSEVLNTLTAAIERISPECQCTVMLLDEEHRQRLLIASGPSLSQAYLQAIDGLEIGPDVGACGTAAFKNETVVVEDIANDPKFASARDFVLSHGLRSCWSQPVRDSNSTVLGTFAIYHRFVARPRPEELRMARVAAQLAGNSIERIRAQKELSDAIKRLNLAETVARFGTWEADFKRDILTLSEGLAVLMEREPSKLQLTKAEFDAMVHPDDRGVMGGGANPTESQAGSIRDEFRLLLPSGAVRWMRSQWCFEAGEGVPTRATGAMIDITQEKNMLARSEQERARAETAARHARQAERLEQEHKTILELVANDQPLNRIVAAICEAVVAQLAGSLCAIKIQLPGGTQISHYPGFPGELERALDSVELASVSETTSFLPIGRLSNGQGWAAFVRSSPGLQHRYYQAVNVVLNSSIIGVIIVLSREECAESSGEQKLLESWGRIASLALERRGLYDELSFRARYDSLTSLLNRAALYESLDACFHDGGGKRSPAAVLYLDLDSFKPINDGHGHDAGDAVLQQVSRRILGQVRATDTVARIGGDEFVIVLPGLGDRAEASRIADAIAGAVARPIEFGGQQLRIKGSIGISMYPVDGSNTDTLLRCADEDMYRVKLSHRGERPKSDDRVSDSELVTTTNRQIA
jgi:diguanylate cyclase (GGDEF)-like protein